MNVPLQLVTVASSSSPVPRASSSRCGINAATRAVRSHLFKLNHEPDPLEDLPSFLPLPQSLILRHELRRRGGLSKGRLDEEEGAGPGGDDAAGHRLRAELRGRGMHVYSNI